VVKRDAVYHSTFSIQLPALYCLGYFPALIKPIQVLDPSHTPTILRPSTPASRPFRFLVFILPNLLLLPHYASRNHGRDKTHIKRLDALKSHNQKEHAWPHIMPIRAFGPYATHENAFCFQLSPFRMAWVSGSTGSAPPDCFVRRLKGKGYSSGSSSSLKSPTR
jgi:hypothetical protein